MHSSHHVHLPPGIRLGPKASPLGNHTQVSKHTQRQKQDCTETQTNFSPKAPPNLLHQSVRSGGLDYWGAEVPAEQVDHSYHPKATRKLVFGQAGAHRAKTGAPDAHGEEQEVPEHVTVHAAMEVQTRHAPPLSAQGENGARVRGAEQGEPHKCSSG